MFTAKLTRHDSTKKMLTPIIIILVITSVLEPIHAQAAKVDSSENSASSSSETKVRQNAERRGGGEYFDANGYSRGYQGHGYQRRGASPTTAALVQPGVARYRYGYFDRQARSFVRVEVEQPVMLGRTEHADSGYGTINSPVYTYAPGYGASSSYGADYASSVPSGGTYGTSYTVHDSNPYGYQDTAASEYIVSGSSEPYGAYSSYDSGYPYQGSVYDDSGYPGTYTAGTASNAGSYSGYSGSQSGDTEPYTSGYVVADGSSSGSNGGNYESSQQSGVPSASNSSPSAHTASYRSNYGSQAQFRPSRTFFKR